MAGVRAPYQETNPRTLAVLSAALNSSSRATRLRAVAMLAILLCPDRERWLESSLCDPDSAVRETAIIASAWVCEHAQKSWPDREDLDANPGRSGAFERIESGPSINHGYEWEYTIEVWRTDGLVLGSFFVNTCAEDDTHARSLALGQAILANTGYRGDRFDPEHAATFIVEKERCGRVATRDRPRREPSDGRQA